MKGANQGSFSMKIVPIQFQFNTKDNEAKSH